MSERRYVVTLLVERSILIHARDEERAKTRAVAVTRNGLNPETRVDVVSVERV